tara:strand:- start:343 stop:735 length:393 start_codon:yes stop_codon:yes gene_type:complete
MKVYCTNCGSGTEYSLNKPQFCSSCGTPFAQLSASAPRRVFKAAPVVASAPIVDEDEEEYEEEYIPSLNGLDFDLQTSKSFNSAPLDQIAGTSNGERDNYRREVDPSYSKESILNDLKREAGSSRSNAQT